MGEVIEHEKVIEQYLRENNQQAAVDLLVELIVKSAREKNFDRADEIRDQLQAMNIVLEDGPEGTLWRVE